MRFILQIGGRGLRTAIAALALLIYVTAPLLHGLVHPDHEIVAVLKAPSGERTGSYHLPAKPPLDQDCALFKLYAGHAGHALAPPALASLAQPLIIAQDVLLPIDPLPAGAPRGFALGRGPPHTA
jgi:hypothetical protein